MEAEEVADHGGVGEAVAHRPGGPERVLRVAARGEAVEQELDFGGHVVEPPREVGETLVGGARLPRADHPLAVAGADEDHAFGVDAAPPRRVRAGRRDRRRLNRGGRRLGGRRVRRGAAAGPDVTGTRWPRLRPGARRTRPRQVRGPRPSRTRRRRPRKARPHDLRRPRAVRPSRCPAPARRTPTRTAAAGSAERRAEAAAPTPR